MFCLSDGAYLLVEQRAWLFFSVHISAESCTLNLLYVISKLSCKIDQVS